MCNFDRIVLSESYSGTVELKLLVPWSSMQEILVYIMHVMLLKLFKEISPCNVFSDIV